MSSLPGGQLAPRPPAGNADFQVQQVVDIRTGAESSNLENLIVFNNALYFFAYDGTDERLYKTDGTEAGTTAIKDLSLGDARVAIDGSTMYFVGNYGSGAKVWKTDGTTNGTVLVKDIANGSLPKQLTVFNGALYFSIDVSG